VDKARPAQETGETAMTKRILLVDDDQDYLASTQLLLESAGYEVTTAEGVGAAKERMSERRPDAAIVDLMMEDTDGGFGLCYHIKKQDQNIPVIMVTAVEHDTGLRFGANTREDQQWIKADVVLSKPIRFEQLQRELTRLLKED
jgi:two-component system OmpR family response regulator